MFIQLDPPAGGGTRPIDDVLKRGNYDLLAHRGTDVERVRETFLVPARDGGVAPLTRSRRKSRDDKMSAYRQIVLASRPRGVPTSSDFRLEEGQVPVAERGQVLVRPSYLALDPCMRVEMTAATPDPIEIGATMAGEVVAE